MKHPANIKRNILIEPFSNIRNKNMSLPSNDDRAPLRHPVMDDKAPVLIPLVVVIPIVFAFLLCFITFCLYRCKKRRAQQTTNNSSLKSIDQDDADIFTTYNDLPNKPVTKEELPPSYNIISETKKDVQLSTSNSGYFDSVKSEKI